VIAALTALSVLLIVVVGWQLSVATRLEDDLSETEQRAEAAEAKCLAFDRESAEQLDEIVALRKLLLDEQTMKCTLVIRANGDEVARYYLDCSRVATAFESMAENTLPRMWTAGGEFTVEVNA